MIEPARQHIPPNSAPTGFVSAPGEPTLPYDRDALFLQNGPLNPSFISDCVRTLMRAMPLDPLELSARKNRRMHGAILALSALHPRDEIEVMIGVQALAAWHAAAACWRIGMNHHRPNGDSTRHLVTAAGAARTFDTLLRALERRQSKPLSVPVGRPPARVWPEQDPTAFMLEWEDRCRVSDDAPLPDHPPSMHTWTPDMLALAAQIAVEERSAADNEGLDIANTEGILPDGGMIIPQYPTPQQEAYMARRLGLSYRQERADNLRRGIQAYPKIRHLRAGDRIP